MQNEKGKSVAEDNDKKKVSERNFFTILKPTPNHENFGKLIKEWADNPESRPTNLTEFRTALEDQGIDYGMPPFNPEDPDRDLHLRPIKRIRFVDLHEEELTIVVPSSNMLRIGEHLSTTDGGEYPFPKEYDKAYHGTPKTTGLDKEQRKKIFLARIGDYSVGNCM